MRIRSLVAAAASAGLVLAVGASAVAAAAPTTLPAPVDYAYVRVLNAMTGQPALDVYVTRVAVDTPPTYPAVKYGTWTAYQKTYFTPDCTGKATCHLEFQVAVPGEAAAFKTDSLDFRAGGSYTVALASTGSTGPNFIVIGEATSKPASSSLRFGNLTTDVTKTLDFMAARKTGSARGSSAAANGVAYAKISVLRPVAAGPWNIQAYPEHTNVALGLPVTNVVLKAAQRYTAYAIGNLGGTDQYAAKFILVPGLTAVKGKQPASCHIEPKGRGPDDEDYPCREIDPHP